MEKVNIFDAIIVVIISKGFMCRRCSRIDIRNPKFVNSGNGFICIKKHYVKKVRHFISIRY
jgi:hypothetical protein